MKTLECEHCGKTMTNDYWGGLKYDGLYFCSQECLDDYVTLNTDLITGEDFELDGEEEDEEEDEVVNDYDVQGSYLND